MVPGLEWGVIVAGENEQRIGGTQEGPVSLGVGGEIEASCMDVVTYAGSRRRARNWPHGQSRSGRTVEQRHRVKSERVCGLDAWLGRLGRGGQLLNVEGEGWALYYGQSQHP